MKPLIIAMLLLALPVAASADVPGNPDQKPSLALGIHKGWGDNELRDATTNTAIDGGKSAVDVTRLLVSFRVPLNRAITTDFGYTHDESVWDPNDPTVVLKSKETTDGLSLMFRFYFGR